MKETRKNLFAANNKVQAFYPGDPGDRQPVHTVYGGAQLFQAEVFEKLKRGAINSLDHFAPSAEALSAALTTGALDRALWTRVYSRVRLKLETEAVEDYRIDFEDGYGTRQDSEEDGHAQQAAQQLLVAGKRGVLPPFIGIRIKPFTNICFDRSVRTLEIFLKTTGRAIPKSFIVTLPKVQGVQQIVAFVKCLKDLEKRCGIKAPIRFEFMVETPQSILDMEGRCPLLEFVQAGEGRCVGAHLGTYDYTASHNIVATYQEMLHPACEFAKQMMKVALSQTGVFLSDGATNVMPVPLHRKESLSGQEVNENRRAVHSAWKKSYDAIQHSLRTGFFQGWDLHPAQIPIRYAAVYAFFLDSLTASTNRLKGFVEKAAQATLLGDVFDDAATGQGLLNFFLRGLSCGALSLDELAQTGLTQDELHTRSFAKILEMRRGK